MPMDRMYVIAVAAVALAVVAGAWFVWSRTGKALEKSSARNKAQRARFSQLQAEDIDMASRPRGVARPGFGRR